MGLISLICPQCGANLEVEEGKDNYFCQYCGTKVIQEKNRIELTNKVTIEGLATETSLLENAKIQLQNGDFLQADSICRKILDINPKSSKAYMGRLLADLRIKSLDELKDYNKPLTNTLYYNRALEFADDVEKAKYISINLAILEKLKKTVDIPECPKEIREPKYSYALLLSIIAAIITDVALMIHWNSLPNLKGRVFDAIINEDGWFILLLFGGLVFIIALVISSLIHCIWKSMYKRYVQKKQQYDEYIKNPEKYLDDAINKRL